MKRIELWALPLVMVVLCAFLNAQASRSSVEESLHTMRDIFSGSETARALDAGVSRELLLGKQGVADSSCIVTLVERWTDRDRPIEHYTAIDLSQISPGSVRASETDFVEPGNAEVVLVAMRHESTIVQRTESRGAQLGNPYSTQRLEIQFANLTLADRFSLALKNAVSLCGGKD